MADKQIQQPDGKPGSRQSIFLNWERKSHDCIDFKKAYVDMAGDLVAGLLLSQIIYWHLPSKDGAASKLRVYRDGEYWLVKQRTDWWDEIRVKPDRFDAACKKLVERGLIVKRYGRFNGLRTMSLRINWDRFLDLWDAMDGDAGPELGK